MRKVVIFAPNIFIGGGLNQLIEITNDLKKISNNSILFLDSRINNICKEKFLKDFPEVKFISSNYLIILFYDFYINFFLKPAKLICLSNYPSLFCFKKIQILFIQNRYYLLEKIDLTFLKKIKIFYIRNLIFFKKNTFNKIIVQTNLMKKITNKNLFKNDLHVDTYLSFKYLYNYSNNPQDIKWDFIYPADDAVHKNHDLIIKSLINLSKESIKPKVIFTIKKNSKLSKRIYSVNKKFGTNITNLGVISEKETINNLKSSRYLLYPSLFESLGLPLLEANYFKIPIISSSESFVFEICKPIATFDAKNIKNIEEIIKKSYLQKNVVSKSKVLQSDNFLNII